MIVGWLEQSETDVPADDEWLGPPELARLADLRFAKRRADWRLGRWTAKSAVAGYLGLPATRATLRAFEIRPAPSGAPEVLAAAGPVPVTISLSHRRGIAVCAVAPACHPGWMLGCDIEWIEPRSDFFLADYFTIEEQRLVERAPRGERFRLLALLWSAKESLLKALRLGLRVDTRSVEVGLEPPATACITGQWNPLRVYHPQSGVLEGWWHENAGFVRTLVIAGSAAYPAALK
jgi:4'-phosphopantetheinyl transferase